jgi:hypothetical protein
MGYIECMTKTNSCVAGGYYYVANIGNGKRLAGEETYEDAVKIVDSLNAKDGYEWGLHNDWVVIHVSRDYHTWGNESDWSCRVVYPNQENKS